MRDEPQPVRIAPEVLAKEITDKRYPKRSLFDQTMKRIFEEPFTNGQVASVQYKDGRVYGYNKDGKCIIRIGEKEYKLIINEAAPEGSVTLSTE